MIDEDEDKDENDDDDDEEEEEAATPRPPSPCQGTSFREGFSALGSIHVERSPWISAAGTSLKGWMTCLVGLVDKKRQNQ